VSIYGIDFTKQYNKMRTQLAKQPPTQTVPKIKRETTETSDTVQVVTKFRDQLASLEKYSNRIQLTTAPTVAVGKKTDKHRHSNQLKWLELAVTSPTAQR
jgi:hypothetical protein